MIHILRRRLAAFAAVAAMAAMAALFTAAHGQTSQNPPSVMPPVFIPMANQPDPHDFVSRAGAQLTLIGRPFRFGGLNIPWLGVRKDGNDPARRPTPYEVEDALETAGALAAAAIRLPGLADTSGCPLCLEPTQGQLNSEAFAQLDLVLMKARDLGLKVVLPLASAAEAAEPGFFTDARRLIAFRARVEQIVSHRNSLTQTLYAEDPTILAWEDCDACAPAGQEQAVSAWTEQLGQTIKAADKHHLFESGAFAGRIGRHAGNPVPPSQYAPPSVDILGDRLQAAGDKAAQRALIEDTLDDIGPSGRAYVLDSFAWGPAVWKADKDLTDWLQAIVRARLLGGAFTGNLQGHADRGGNLPAPPPSSPGVSALYFPGVTTPEMDQTAMVSRTRLLRRFGYAMIDLTEPPNYALTPKPEIVSVSNGRVVWRGAAGAAAYTIERSPDPGTPFSWETVCDACTTDAAGFWQDPSPPTGQLWYRVMPWNINLHRSEPSEPFQNKPN